MQPDAHDGSNLETKEIGLGVGINAARLAAFAGRTKNSMGELCSRR